MNKDKDKFLKFSDLPTGEYQIIINGRENGITLTSAMIMLKWLQSVLIVYDDRGKFLLGIKPQYNEQECLVVIRDWLNEKNE